MVRRQRPPLLALRLCLALTFLGHTSALLGLLRPRVGGARISPRMAAFESAPSSPAAAQVAGESLRSGSSVGTGLLQPSTETLQHGNFLPKAMTSTLISQREKLVLGFLLEFLHDQGFDAPLFLSGGYVRAVPPQLLRGVTRGATARSHADTLSLSSPPHTHTHRNVSFLPVRQVRDLLLGETPDDMDVSIDLRACPPDVSIASLTAALPRCNGPYCVSVCVRARV